MQVRTWRLISCRSDAKEQSYLSHPQKPPSPPAKAWLRLLLPHASSYCLFLASTQLSLVPERLLQEVMGATTAWLCQREGLAEPWAGSCVCPWSHRRCSAASDAAGAREGAAWAVPRHYCPLFTRSHLDASFLCHFFFVLKEAGEGRGKAPEIPPPSVLKRQRRAPARPRR